MNLTPAKASKVKSPLIEESPVNIECRVTEIRELGSHHMFLAEVLAVNVSEEYLDDESGAFHMEKAGLISFIHGKYYGSAAPLGKFGYSVQKPREKQRWTAERKKSPGKNKNRKK